MTAKGILGFLIALGTLTKVDAACLGDDSWSPDGSPPAVRKQVGRPMHRVLDSTQNLVPSQSISPEGFVLATGESATLDNLIFWAEGVKRRDVFGLVLQVRVFFHSTPTDEGALFAHPSLFSASLFILSTHADAGLSCEHLSSS
jgi:hypothetical protein